MIDPDLLIDPSDHDLLIDRLILSSDKIVIEIFIHIIDILHEGERLVDKDIVHVKGVLWELQSAVPEHLRAVDDGMHEDVLTEQKVLHLLPAEDPVLGEGCLIAHDLLSLLPDLVVDKICDKHIDRSTGEDLLPKLIEHAEKDRAVQPVIGVHHLKEESLCVPKSRIDRLAVSPVLLMDRSADSRILRLILLRDFQRIVLSRSVVNDDDLKLITAGQDALDAAPHIGGGIITGNRKTD